MTVDQVRAKLEPHRGRTYHRGNVGFQQVLEVLHTHPIWGERHGDVQGIRMRTACANGALQLQLRTSFRWFTVSWRKCALRKQRCSLTTMTDTERALIAAMRQAVVYQCRAWKCKQSNVECAACGSQHQLQVDHRDPPFHEIRRGFMASEKHPPTEFGYLCGNCTRTLLPTDRNFRRKWQAFHARLATLQLLCRSCNLAKGGTTVLLPDLVKNQG
jgi:hypothetical protein